VEKGLEYLGLSRGADEGATDGRVGVVWRPLRLSLSD
jgi:hypothetical protein